MGKSMFDFGNQAKEKARQRKQMDKAAKRQVDKQRKGNIGTSTPQEGAAVSETIPQENVLPHNEHQDGTI
jgi:hypothetical protein